MKNVNLYFFRHGQTDWNLQKRFQGSHDIPLNATGREQALELQTRMAKLPIEVILSSDLIRAKETAQIAFAKHSLATHFFPELREANLGDMEGMLREKFLKDFGQDMWEKWISPHPDLLDFKFPGGETKRETRQRVIKCIEAFIGKNPHEHVAISTHGGVISRIVHFCQGAPAEPVPIPNGCLYHIMWDQGKWIFIKEINS